MKALRPASEPGLYHGVATLELHVGDAIPTPRAPERFAVRVYPDLARYLLGFNHPDNRTLKDNKIIGYAADMTSGRWLFTPQGLVFSVSPLLMNGQNSLTAVTVAGIDVWLMVDFGWPDEIVNVLDRGAARGLADGIRMSGYPSAQVLSACFSRVSHYNRTVGLTRLWSGLPTPTQGEALDALKEDAEPWIEAARVGNRVYQALDLGGAPSLWAAAYRIISLRHPGEAAAFFAEIAEGTGKPESTTRKLADFYRRRSIGATFTSDAREPMENAIRAFNAWYSGRRMAFVKAKAFELSAVRP